MQFTCTQMVPRIYAERKFGMILVISTQRDPSTRKLAQDDNGRGVSENPGLPPCSGFCSEVPRHRDPNNAKPFKFIGRHFGDILKILVRNNSAN